MWTLLHATGTALASWASTQLLAFPLLVGIGAIVIAFVAGRRRSAEKKLAQKDINIERLIINLERLMSNTWTGSISSFDVTVPENVKISRNVLNGLRTAVESYNKSVLPSSERSRSILDSRSVHFIWCQLLEAIRADEDSTSPEERTRVVYEWCIPHPLTGTAL